MNFSFLHAADIHLDSPLRGLEADAPAELIRGASRRALQNLVNLALTEQVAFVLLAGDLYDVGWRDWRTGHFLVEQLGILKREGIRVFSISGNHDADRVLKKQLSLPDGMFPSDRPSTVHLPGHGVTITGQSYAEREMKADLAAGYPVPDDDGLLNIAMLHTACGQGGHENYAPCTPDQLRRLNYDYWALGHVHARRVLSEAPWIVFPGVLQGRHVNEPGANGASLVRVQDGRIASVEHRPLDVLRWARVPVDLAGAMDEAAALEQVRQALDTAVAAADGRSLAARVTLTGACPAHGALMRDGGDLRGKLIGAGLEVATQDQLWLERIDLRTTPAIDREALREDPGVQGELVRALDDEDGLADSAAAFLSSLLRDGMAQAMPDGSPVALAARGALPAELIERARALLLSGLVT